MTGWWFSPGTPVSSTDKTDRHDITQILLTWRVENAYPNSANMESLARELDIAQARIKVRILSLE